MFVINLLSKTLDRDTPCVLGYGLSFPYEKDINPVQIGRSLYQLDKCSSKNSDLIRVILYGALFKENNTSIPTRFVKALEKLKKRQVSTYNERR